MVTTKFKIKKVTPIEDLVSGVTKELPESDLCIQSDNHIVQFKLEESKRIRKKKIVQPGVYNFIIENGDVKLDTFELKKLDLLESITNTKKIIDESNFFFNRLNIYEKLGIDKKRALLLYGLPGTGKTASITKVCNQLLNEDKGTVIVNWNSAIVPSGLVLDFFTSSSQFSKDCTKLIFIIEDIGADYEGNYGQKQVDRSLLNLLDGVGVAFTVPTLIIATTNYAENLPENLANRPGRFDLMFEVDPPSAEERVELVKFIAKRELTEKEIQVIKSTNADKFSIAHLKEIVVRSELNDKSIEDIVNELNAHAKKFNKGFKGSATGLGF